MRISGRIVILTVIIITAIAALFCIIGLATKNWPIVVSDPSGSLFCNGCSKTPAALSIISFILLIVSVVALVLQMLDILNGPLRFVPIIVLFIATIFLLATFGAYFGIYSTVTWHSYNLIVVAHFFAYIALTVLAYWLGQLDGGTSG
jgi:hypothetical protein